MLRCDPIRVMLTCSQQRFVRMRYFPFRLNLAIASDRQRQEAAINDLLAVGNLKHSSVMCTHNHILMFLVSEPRQLRLSQHSHRQ
jgi:hypothetical protein